MHPQFAEWYRPLLIQPDDKLLKSRWALVEHTARNLTVPLALDLVRLSFGLPVQDDAAIAALKQQLKTEGLNYVRATANLELVLIGDCVLLELIDRHSDKKSQEISLSGSALICQRALRQNINRTSQADLFRQSRPIVDDLAIKSRKTAAASAKITNIDPIPHNKTSPNVNSDSINFMVLDWNRNQSWKTLNIANSEQINHALSQLLSIQNTYADSLDKKMSSIIAVAQSMLDQVGSLLCSPQEENSIQWYLLGETSRDLHRPFASFQLAELIPIAAKELADLTAVLPGPYAALAYLDRILTHGRSRDAAETQVSLRAAVQAVQSLWRTNSISVAGFDAVQDLTPVLCALSYATAGSDDWLTMVPQLCHVPVETELPAREMAYQLYQEILFARLAKQHLATKGAK